MKTECEIRFLKIDKELFRWKLYKNNAFLVQKEYLMKREIFDLPFMDKAWVRIRQEASK